MHFEVKIDNFYHLKTTTKWIKFVEIFYEKNTFIILWSFSWLYMSRWLTEPIH